MRTKIKLDTCRIYIFISFVLTKQYLMYIVS